MPKTARCAPAALQWAVERAALPGRRLSHASAHRRRPAAAAVSWRRNTAPTASWSLTLTATDSGGRAASVSRDIRPRLVSVTLRTEPPGLPVVFGESRRLSPATFAAVVGSHMNVATLSPQHSLTFTGWASGRAQQHALTIGATDVVDTARFSPPAGVSYLSDLAWTSATNGAGPIERDRSHGDAAAGDGPPLTLRGVTYAKGLGVLAPSDLRVRLNGACTTFAATLGIDDDVQGGGSVFAGVLVDGRLAYVSGPMNGVTARQRDHGRSHRRRRTARWWSWTAATAT